MSAGLGSLIFNSMEEELVEQGLEDVTRFYFEDGMASRVAQSEWFELGSEFVIFLNVVWIGMETNYNQSDLLYRSHPVFIVAANFFCVFYSFEWFTRFFAFESKCDCFQDSVIQFDAFLLFLIVFEVWILEPTLLAYGDSHGFPTRPLQLMRLLRLSRLVRLLRFMPELMMMCKGMLMAIRAVASTLVMIAILVYAYGIVIFTMLRDEPGLSEKLPNRNFSSLFSTMWLLLLDGALMDDFGHPLTTLLHHGQVNTTIACFTFLTFIFLSALTLMNMLIGVMSEVVSSMAENEKNERDVRLVRSSIMASLEKFDNGDGLITKDELGSVMEDPESQQVLLRLNVDQLFLLELQSMLFREIDDQVSIKQVVEMMLMCRGDSPATVRTFSTGILYLSTLMHKIHEQDAQGQAAASAIEKDLKKSMHYVSERISVI